MAKKRTRKNKEKVHHQFLYSWDQNEDSKASVNRDLNFTSKLTKTKLSKSEKADIMAKETLLASNKKSIVRSLMLASFILVAELVIYLGWNGFIN